MTRKVSISRRAVRLIALLIVIAIIALYILLPVGFGVAAVMSARKAVGAPPGGFQEVALETDDGVTLAGWYAPPTNGAAIILLHGAGGSRDAVRGYAAMLVRHGYGALALDQRGHGASSGATNRLGWEGTRDVAAAVAYLQTRPEVERIGGLGLSMGGEVLLGAASTFPAIQAIVADGATRRCLADLLALPSERSLVRNFTARVSFAVIQVLSGDAPPEPPLLESMVAADSTAFLLIAAGSDRFEVDFNTLFAGTVPERTTLWVAPNVSHIGAFSRYPDEYEQRVIAFFDAALPAVPVPGR